MRRKESPRSIAAARPFITGWACTCKYRYIHFVRAPLPDQADPVTVDAHAEEGYGPARAGRTDGNHIADGVGRVRVEEEGDADSGREVGREDVVEWRKGAWH